MSMAENFSDDFDIEQMFDKGQNAANFLNAMAHEGRLMILSHPVNGEKSVTELQNSVSSRQAAARQQLSCLRIAGIASFLT